MFSAFSADVPTVSVSSSTGNERESATVTLPAPYWPKDRLLPKGTRDFYTEDCVLLKYANSEKLPIPVGVRASFDDRSLSYLSYFKFPV